MPTSCGVVGCSNNRVKTPSLNFFKLPSVIKTDQESEDLSLERRRLWLAKVNRKDLTEHQLAEKKSSLFVCSKHFGSGKPAHLFERYHPDWAPSKFLKPNRSPEAVDQTAELQSLKRLERRERRNCVKDKFDDEEKESVDMDIENEEEANVSKDVYTQTEPVENYKEIYEQLRNDHVKLKEETDKRKFNIEQMQNGNERILYYTGLPDYIALSALYELVKGGLGRGVFSSFEKLILCLMRLRHGTAVVDLADRFQVLKTTASNVSNVFLQTFNVLFIKLKPLICWPAREELSISMPTCFRARFGTKITTVIDCFELFIDRPSNLTARALTWSHYKNHNTVKYLTGITPQGTISFISNGWRGRTSDQYITENSEFLKNLEYGDTVMADRGFKIAETLGTCRRRLEIPSFTKGKSQLSANEVEKTRVIANVRIHVERVIGILRRKYSILNKTLPIDFLLSENDEIPTLDKIVHVSCALINMCQSVVPLG